MNDYAHIRGVNYFYSNGRSFRTLWDEFDAQSVNIELSYAAALGFNAVRTWLNYFAFEQDNDGFLRKLADFLSICEAHGLAVVLNLFDSCGIDPTEHSDETQTILEAYTKYQADSRLSPATKQLLRSLGEVYATTVARDARIPCTKTDPSVVFWQWHTANPGMSGVQDEQRWPDFERYVTAVLQRFGDHPQILFWDLMNEPDCARMLTMDADMEAVKRFVRHFFEVAAAIQPRKPITVGHTDARELALFEELAATGEVLTFHTYEPTVAGLRARFAQARQIAARWNKPVLVTECLAKPYITDPHDISAEAQLALYREHLPVVLESGLGFFSVTVMQGKFPWSWLGYYYPDGLRKPVADYIEAMLRPGN